MFSKLKKKWGVESDIRLMLIFIAFSTAGSATIFIRKPIFHLLGINSETPFVFKVLLYVMTVTPSYFVMLMVIGTLLGQYRFFLAFEKKMLSRFKRK